MALLLGMDGGATKTACAVGDERRVLGTATAGPSNLGRVGETAARQALHEAVTAACAAAGIDRATLGGTCMGVAGLSAPAARATMRRLLGELVGGSIEVVGDMEIALHAAFGNGPGVVVIAGTGSIAYGRNDAGETARAGGWGHAISDEGSGHWIGRRAVTALLQARDRGEETALLAAARQGWGLADDQQLAAVANRQPPPAFAQLVPAVIGAAAAGDAVAYGVLRAAGEELATLAATVCERVWPAPRQAVAIGLAGGVFEHSELVREAFCRAVCRWRPQARVNCAIVQPVMGALARARLMLGESPVQP